MGVNNETLYLKIEQNTIVYDRHVVLNDIAKMECTNEAVLRQLKQKKIYSFTNQKDEKKEKNQMQVFSVLKIIEQIHEDYPSLTISNEGESDFIIEYIPNPEKPKVMNTIKTVLLCIIIFFGSAFTIMAFNNDVDVSKLFGQIYELVIGKESNGFTILEIMYSVGLVVGILIFFNHFGKKRFTVDPTPMEVQMRLYENDLQTTLIENISRKEQEVDVGTKYPTGSHRS